MQSLPPKEKVAEIRGANLWRTGEITIPFNYLETYLDGWYVEPGTYQTQLALDAGEPALVFQVEI
jgi:hypothetical protein